MANADDEGKFLCRDSDGFLCHEESRNNKCLDMILNIGTKSDSFPSDQTPTPIRLIQRCEEMGLFQDLQNVNPFEETFRKAAEGIRSGESPLEISSLSIPNDADDSLHTPHVTFPVAGETAKRKGLVSPRDFISIPVIQPETDPLSITLDDNGNEDDNGNPEKYVVQQEADTSGEAQRAPAAQACEDENNLGTIQFLLRMPNGKMVKLSSLPVEEMDTTTSKSKENDIPIIKVDSSFLKSVGEKAQLDNINLCSTVSTLMESSNISNAHDSVFNSTDVNNVVCKSSFMEANHFKASTHKISENEDSTTELSKMALAKLKLKQALMNNTCPASNLSSSSSVISSSVISRPTGNFEYKPIEERRSSSQSDDAEKYDEIGRSLSTVEEKRRRNRAAAMRCREKRKTWVKELERRANDMLRTNGQLQHEVSMLRDEVAQLKTLLLAHRDCPVTQALVQGNATLPSGTTLQKPGTNKILQSARRTATKDSKSSSSTIVLQSPVPVKPVKPIILLNDPPAKRKRLSLSTNNPGITVNSTATPVSVVASPPTSSVVHTLVLPSKSASALNPTFVNMIPSVLVANPVTAAGSSGTGAPQVIYSQLLPGLPTLTSKSSVNIVTPRQTFILPKANVNHIPPERNTSGKQPKSEMKPRSAHFLSTNVIKLNPNVMDCDTNDSDIEILDVKPVGS